ncbi:MAG: c-type cytochrome [Chloroflexi bacterium]|nr:c-type cytochrome [Chloroflexota bacterium]
MKGHLILPVGLLGAVLALGASLVVVVTLRPWASADEGYNTHLNFRGEVPSDYGRTSLTWLSTQGNAPMGWALSSKTPKDVDKGYALYVAAGCASCHGFKGEGGVLGHDLLDVTKAKIGKETRRGPAGMPAYPESDLAIEQLALITEYLLGLQEAAPSPDSGVLPAITPTPTTPAGVAPLTPTPTREAAMLATPTPAPSPEATSTPVATPSLTGTATALPTPSLAVPGPGALVCPPAPAPTSPPSGHLCLEARRAAITVDGKTTDWAAIERTGVTLAQVKPIPSLKMGKLAPIVVDLKVAVDSQKVYVLVEVPDDYDWVRTDPYLSGKVSVMFRIDDPAAPHMGTTEEEQKKSLGMVDMWHWTPACGPGEVAGGGGVPGGKDPKCSLNDEWSTTPTIHKTDNTPQAENSLAGAWEHTGRAGGPGASGTWVFEMSRPLATGDPQDVQLKLRGKAYVALAYWDPDETPDGWTEVGHLQSATPHDWVEVLLPV